MKSITTDEMNEIAQELECDFRAFIHKTTGKLLFVPNEINFAEMDMEFWEEETQELENNFSDYDEIEKWSKNQAFNLMTEFAKQLNNRTLQNKLLSALENYKPFKQFKYIIDNSGDYREAWFAFKNEWQYDYVAEKLRKMGYLG